MGPHNRPRPLYWTTPCGHQRPYSAQPLPTAPPLPTACSAGGALPGCGFNGPQLGRCGNYRMLTHTHDDHYVPHAYSSTTISSSSSSDMASCWASSSSSSKAVSLDNVGSHPRYWPCVYFALFRTGSARRTPGDLRGAGGRPAGVPITFFRCEVFNMRAHSTPSRLAHSVCLGFLI